MRKILLTFAVLVTFILAACDGTTGNTGQSELTSSQVITSESKGSVSVPSQVDESSNVTDKSDDIYGIAMLGYGEELSDVEVSDYLTETQLGNLEVVFYEGDEFYLIVPTMQDAIIEVYSVDPNDEIGGIIDMLSRTVPGAPVLLRCNLSDIMQNTSVRIESEKGIVSFSPHISLKDGSVAIEDGGYMLKPLESDEGVGGQQNSSDENSDEDYIEKIIAVVGEEYIAGRSFMRAEDEIIYDNLCAVFRIGTNTSEKFTTEEWLAVTHDGTDVYWYVVQDDNWLGWSTQN